MTAGSDIDILAESGNSYYIRYWTDSGQARERYVNKGAVRKAGEKEEPVNNNDAVAEKVKNRIWWMKSNLNGYKDGSKYTGSGECRGFANNVYTYLFPGVSKISGYTGDNFGATYYNGSKVVARLTGFGANDSAAVKAFFYKAKPGYFIQMGRRYSLNSKKDAAKPHSAILASVTANGCYFYEANADNKNTIKYNWYTWGQLADRNRGYTLYAPNNYQLK